MVGPKSTKLTSRLRDSRASAARLLHEIPVSYPSFEDPAGKIAAQTVDGDIDLMIKQNELFRASALGQYDVLLKAIGKDPAMMHAICSRLPWRSRVGRKPHRMSSISTGTSGNPRSSPSAAGPGFGSAPCCVRISPRAGRRLFIPAALSTCNSCLLMINSRKWHP